MHYPAPAPSRKGRYMGHNKGRAKTSCRDYRSMKFANRIVRARRRGSLRLSMLRSLLFLRGPVWCVTSTMGHAMEAYRDPEGTEFPGQVRRLTKLCCGNRSAIDPKGN